MEQIFLWKLELDSKKLHKWKEEMDSINLKTQQFGVELHALKLELKKQREVEQATKETPEPEGNEVSCDLPPRFGDCEEKKTIEEENRRMCLMVVQEEVVEKMENSSKLHKHTPPNTFPDKPGAPIPTHSIDIQIPLPSFPTTTTPPKPNHKSLSSILYTPSLRVLPTFKEWKHIAPLAWKAHSVEDTIFNWLILVFGLFTALLDYQD